MMYVINFRYVPFQFVETIAFVFSDILINSTVHIFKIFEIPLSRKQG